MKNIQSLALRVRTVEIGRRATSQYQSNVNDMQRVLLFLCLPFAIVCCHIFRITICRVNNRFDNNKHTQKIMSKWIELQSFAALKFPCVFSSPFFRSPHNIHYSRTHMAVASRKSDARSLALWIKSVSDAPDFNPRPRRLGWLAINASDADWFISNQ